MQVVCYIGIMLCLLVRFRLTAWSENVLIKSNDKICSFAAIVLFYLYNIIKKTLHVTI